MVQRCLNISEQFQGDVKQGISAFTGEPRPLNDPITESEVEQSMNHLKNNRASGSDEFPGELLKHGLNIIAKPVGDVFNHAITDQHTLSEMGHGILILLPKSGNLSGGNCPKIICPRIFVWVVFVWVVFVREPCDNNSQCLISRPRSL